MPRPVWIALLVIAACHTSAPPGASPPVAGVALGEGPWSVRRTLGDPDKRQAALGLVFWEYERDGLSLLWDEEETVLQGLVLKKRTVGPVEGVAVGDSATVMLTRWGEPVRVRQDRRFFDFVRPGWIQSAEVHGGRVVEITVLAKHTP